MTAIPEETGAISVPSVAIEKLVETDRPARLVRITAAIAQAVTREEVFEALVDQAAAAVGASGAALWILQGDGCTAALVRAIGYSDAQMSQFGSVAIDSATRFPALDTIKTGRPLWFSSKDEMLDRYPDLSAHTTPGRKYTVSCLPLIVEGRTLGGLAFTFDGGAPILDDDRAFLLLIARYSSQALERLRLLDAERTSRMHAEILFSFADAVIRAKDQDDIFAAALDAIERGLAAKRSSILVYDSDGVMRFKAWRGLSDGYRAAVEGHSPWKRDALNPQPILIPDVDVDPTMASYLPLFRTEKIGAIGFIPLVASGELLGKFMVYYGGPRVLEPGEVDLARAIANHVAVAILRYEAVADLQETIRFNEMFTGILGHDLRNPLQAIMTAAQLVVRRSESEKIAKPMARILSSGERMIRMIDQLLDFTRVRIGGGIPVRKQSFDLLPLVRQIVDELDDANPGWTLRLDHKGDTVGEWDADRLGQVFSNLVGNAVQHGAQENGVLVRIDGLKPEVVRVEIHNTGTISPELLAKLFDPMSRAALAASSRRSGLGLGLYITLQIVEAHGGRIEVQSSEVAGTAFIVTLPRS
jgi:signal transduction histidine kinase